MEKKDILNMKNSGFINISPLPASQVVRKQIVDLIVEIQRDEYLLPETEEIHAVLNAEKDFYHHGICNFWYVTNEVGKIIGSIGLRKLDDKTGEIKKFFVHKNYRGKGIAQKLMHVLVQAAAKYQFEFLYLGSAAVLKAAHRFYEKYGFSPIERKYLPQIFKPFYLDSYFFKGEVTKLLTKENSL